jgi:hypothetical protein
MANLAEWPLKEAEADKDGVGMPSWSYNISPSGPLPEDGGDG